MNVLNKILPTNLSNLNDIFLDACKVGNIQKLKMCLQENCSMKYFLNKNKLNLNKIYNDSVNKASQYNNYETLMFLLEYNVFNKYKTKTTYIFANYIACKEGNIEVVKYFFKKFAMFKSNHLERILDGTFLYATKDVSGNVIKYLIFDYNIQQTEEIKKIIEDKPEIQKLFELRELNKNLAKELSEKKINIRKKKI